MPENNLEEYWRFVNKEDPFNSGTVRTSSTVAIDLAALGWAAREVLLEELLGGVPLAARKDGGNLVFSVEAAGEEALLVTARLGDGGM